MDVPVKAEKKQPAKTNRAKKTESKEVRKKNLENNVKQITTENQKLELELALEEREQQVLAAQLAFLKAAMTRGSARTEAKLNSTAAVPMMPCVPIVVSRSEIA